LLSKTIQPKLKLSIPRFFVELSLWYLPTLAFLSMYIGHYGFPFYSATAHLFVVTHFILIAVILRYLLIRLIGRKWGSIGASFIYGGLFFSLILYYCLVVIGLTSWRNVISSELMIAYASQLPELCEAFGISFGLLMASLLGLLVILIRLMLSVVHFTNTKFEVTSTTKRYDHLATLALGLLFISSHFFMMNAVIGSEEPISLTLAKKTAHSNQSTNSSLNWKETEASQQYTIQQVSDKKNVILIVVDALRPDHMGVYGYERNTTPNLSQLMTKVNHFEVIRNVRSTCGASSCGLSSLDSSRYVHKPERPMTLHNTLQRYGYRTTMILGGDHTNFYNLREEYGHIDDYFDGSMATGYYINDDRFVINKTRDLVVWNTQPIFIQYHLMSTHTLSFRLREYQQFLPSRKFTPFTSEPPNEEFTNSYDNAVLQADAMIAELLHILKEKNYLKNAIVVITADHGEGLGDHGKFSHSNSVHEELLRIPFILIDFGGSSKNVPTDARLLSQTDIAPTILHELKIPAPSTWMGFPIQTQIKRDFLYFRQSEEIGLYDLRDPEHLWKYWKNLLTKEEYVFDLSKDSTENYNLISKISEDLTNQWRLKSTLNDPHDTTAEIAFPKPFK